MASCDLDLSNKIQTILSEGWKIRKYSNKYTPNYHVQESNYRKKEKTYTRQRKAWHPLAGGKVDLDLLSRDPRSLWVPPLIIHNLHVKFESDWAKTAVCIVSTRSYTQSAKVDLDLWPRDPKSIGFLLSSSTTYMWSLKVIGQKLQSVSCPQGLIHRVPKSTLTFDPVTPNQ